MALEDHAPPLPLRADRAARSSDASRAPRGWSVSAIVLTIATIVCAAPALAVLIQAGFVIAERGAALTDPL